MQKRKQDWQRSISSICSDGSRINSKRRPASQTEARGKVKSPALKNRGRGTQNRLRTFRLDHWTHAGRFPSLSIVDSRLSTCCDLCIESERSLCPTSPHRNALSRRCLPSRE